jgi:soluble lytic murein transglycosylase-like protein
MLIVAEERPHPSPAVLSRPSGPAADPFGRQRGELDFIVQSAALAQRLDPALLHAVIGVESAYATRAVSARGAQGLMQLMPPTAKEYGVTDAFDPRQNIVAGARHLRLLLDQFDQNTALALAAYNAGASAVLRHRRQIPPFSETVAYVPRVLGRYAALRQEAR